MPSTAPYTKLFWTCVMRQRKSWTTPRSTTSWVEPNQKLREITNARARGRNKKAPSFRWWPTAFQIGEKMLNRTLGVLLLISVFSSIGLAQGNVTVVRVGAFPNITHPQAMVGKGNGWFEKAMGPNVKIEWKTFNAGPAAIEALFAGAIDMTYIGPNPTIQGYVRSNGEALRIIAGATSGGASLVVRSDSGIQKPEDFHARKIASPQQGK